MTSNWQTPQPLFQQQPLPHGGLPVRTTLRAGLAWDDLDDQAQALWDKLTLGGWLRFASPLL
jgi:hypothetical protein